MVGKRGRGLRWMGVLALVVAGAVGSLQGQTETAPKLAPEPVKPAPKSPTQAEIDLQRKLDQPFTLSLQKVELSEAFKQIAATAQISLQVDQACYDALPYGATTRVAADFRESKLKTAIEEILVPLSLQQTVSGATVVIRPAGPLARIGRRADWEELKLLHELRTSPDLKLPANGEFDWTAAIRGTLESRPNVMVSFAGEATLPRATHDKAMEQVKKQLPLSGFRALELYCQLTNQVWFVEAGPLAGSGAGSANGGAIRVMPVRAWITRQLERPIQLSFTNAPLEQVVAEFSHASGIRFTPEAGLYREVPAVSLGANNCSVAQALEMFSGVTRIGFEIREDSIFLRLPGKAPAAPAVAPRDPYIGRITVPFGRSGMSMDFFLHESDLTPELLEMLKQKKAESVEELKKSWMTPAVAPGPAPESATVPATQPVKPE